MIKERIVNAAIRYIESESKDRNLIVENNGTGHAFDGTFWRDLLKDTSGIPNVIARSSDYDFSKSVGYKIELRSLWGRPEIDIRDGGNLLVLNYSDYVRNEEGTLVNSRDFRVNEVRVDGYDYKENLNRIFKVIETIEKYARDLEADKEQKK